LISAPLRLAFPRVQRVRSLDATACSCTEGGALLARVFQ
jgi:hypothetical protein